MIVDDEILRCINDSREIYVLISPFFKGNDRKMRAWYESKNPLLGGLSPAKMVALGKTDKLKKFIENQLEENER